MVLSGFLLYVVLICLGVWLVMVCRTSWRSIRTPVINNSDATDAVRARLTPAGLTLSAVAVASLFCLHTTWISPSISQGLGATPIRIFVTLLFLATLLGFLFSILGTGKTRFWGVGTCVITGLWWVSLWTGAAISGAAPLARHPVKYLIPGGYVGWVELKHDVPTASALPLEGGTLICRFPQQGVLLTSSSLESGWAKDQYFYYLSDGSIQVLKETGWGNGGMIWAGQNSTTEQYFYVGTEQQFHKGVSINKIRPF